jgi:hypothetical protein
MSKTIITCAITGNLTKPEMTPYLPITPEQIANSALEAAEAGAAVAHIHVRHPDGKPSMELEHYAETINLIKKHNKECNKYKFLPFILPSLTSFAFSPNSYMDFSISSGLRFIR